jgi:hypothetical protein
MSPVLTLDENRLYALCNPYPLDGRVTWHPPTARGFAPMNSYVLMEDDAALIVDTGISIHEHALLDQLATLVTEATQLAVIHTRIGEYTSICNTVPIADRFGLTTLYSEQPDSPLWVDFRPRRGRDRGTLGALSGTRVEQYSSPGSISVGETGRRTVAIFHSSLRLLPTSWLYDEQTRTLFTSDLFSHLTRPTSDGPWLVGAVDDGSAARRAMRQHLFEARYWWLPGARTDPIRRSIADTFDRYDVETIAPGFGCVLHGHDLVDRQYQMLDDILAEAQRLAQPGR